MSACLAGSAAMDSKAVGDHRYIETLLQSTVDPRSFRSITSVVWEHLSLDVSGGRRWETRGKDVCDLPHGLISPPL